MTVHEHVQQTLSAMRDGQADPDQRFLAERHLRCAACRAVAEAFAGVDTLAQGPAAVRAAAVRGGPGQRLAAAPAHGISPPSALRRRLWLAGVAAVLAVAALVIVSIVVSPAGRGPLPVPTTTPDRSCN